MSPETLFLVNPVAGGRAGASLKKELDLLVAGREPRGSCETAFTAADGGLAGGRSIADYRTVIVAGGDGTVARIVQELSRMTEKPRLGIIPCGTGNDLARAAGVLGYYRKKGLPALINALLSTGTRPLDIFSINEKLYFTNYCGIGLDAKISNDFNQERNSPVVRAAAFFGCGRAAYPWFALRNFWYRMPFPLELTCGTPDGKRRTMRVEAGARQVLITSISSYGGGAHPAAGCSPDDGMFEVTAIATLWQWFMLHMTRFFPVKLTRILPDIVQCSAAELRACFSGSTCFQADGELYEDFSGAGLSVRRAAQLEFICL